MKIYYCFDVGTYCIYDTYTFRHKLLYHSEYPEFVLDLDYNEPRIIKIIKHTTKPFCKVYLSRTTCKKL